VRSSALSKIRITFSFPVILVVAGIFLDIRHLVPERFINPVLFLQFIPSANKLISAGVAAAAGFIVILLLTLVTGRVYCSFLCPLGILQDVISRIGGRIKRKFRRYGFRKPFTILRYSILAITLIFTMLWGVNLLTILDPYSIFGRFMTYFGRPVIIILNNILAHIFGKFDIYTFIHTGITSFPPATYLVPLATLILIGFLSLTKGRLFCNTVCPVGTFLGLISKISILRIKFDNVKCTKCGRCAVACKANCIDFLNMEIDYSRCVDCFNCLKSCPDYALEYGLVKIRRNSAENTENIIEDVDQGRRNTIIGFMFLIFGLSRRLSGQEKTVPVPKKASTVKEQKTSPVCPPGSASISNFTANCTACSLCVSVCPNNVLVPSLNEYGLASIMQPRMDYHKGFCAYECISCLEICPTGALLPLVIDAKKLTQIGKAIFIKDNCIVNTEKTACGACAEACPTKAVHMVPFEGNLVIPETTEDICIGCGHCENACPTKPYKAIFVDGNPVHATAKKPENVQTDMKKPEEFPF
jgi:polyferredoxin